MPRTITHSSLMNIAEQVNTCFDGHGFREDLVRPEPGHMANFRNRPLRGVAIQAAPA